MADGLRSLLLERCEGIILIDPDISMDALAHIVDRTPAVLIGSSTELSDVDEIHSRDDVGIQLLVDHLVDTGVVVSPMWTAGGRPLRGGG